MAMNIIRTKNMQLILYGASLAVLMFLVKWLELAFVFINFSVEIYAGVIALLFTGLGIWMTLRLIKPKMVIIEKQVPATAGFLLNEELLKELRISSRELEVLGLMAQGLSNRQMAEHLYVSVPTIKTHANNLFLKLEAQRNH